MADPLSLTASIIAILQISDSVLSTCFQYIGTFRTAKEDIFRIVNVVSSLKGVISHIEALINTPVTGRVTSLQLLNILGVQGGSLAICKAALHELEANLGSESATVSMKNRIKWLWKEKEIAKLLRIIENQKTTIILALGGDSLALSLCMNREIEDLCKSVNSLSTSQNYERIINWITPCDPSSNHLVARARHEFGTGHWLVESIPFKLWLNSGNRSIWLHGIPGSGKTILASTIIEKVKLDCASVTSAEYAYFYFDFSDRLKQSVASFLRSIIAQLSIRRKSIPVELQNLYNICDAGKQQPGKKSLIETMMSISASSSRIYLIVDALDECSERESILEIINLFLGHDFKSMNVLVTSRMERDIVESLQNATDNVICIQERDVDLDIALHVQTCLSNDPKLRRWNDAVKEEILDSLVRGAHGMFRWAVCQLESLRKCIKPSALRLALRELPKTLDETYDRIIESIPNVYKKEGHAILQLLAFSERQLSLSEVAEAVTVDLEKQCFDPEDRLREPEVILEICSSLVILSSSRIEDRTENTNLIDEDKEIRFAHYSVKEYLISRHMRNPSLPSSAFAFSEMDAHRFISEICLTYLLSLAELSDFRGLWFIEYAAQYWYVHAAIAENASRTKELLKRLFGIQGFRFVDNWLKVWNPDGRLTFKEPLDSDHFCQPLYYSSVLGLIDVTNWLLESGAQVNSVGGEYGNPLQAAVLSRNQMVVRLLLQSGADVNLRGGHFETALQAAAWLGNVEMVQLLLECGADVNAQGGEYGSALVAASAGPDLTWSQNRAAAVGLLLRSGADVNAEVPYYGNALEAAARAGREDVARLLLTSGANIHARGGIYGSCLPAAARAGNVELVRLFLTLRAEIGNSLQSAAWGGHDKVVRLLLEHGADIDADGGDYGTALHAAKSQGHENVVELILNWRS